MPLIIGLPSYITDRGTELINESRISPTICAIVKESLAMIFWSLRVRVYTIKLQKLGEINKGSGIFIVSERALDYLTRTHTHT